jgi:quercetin dioxygenase-like cupin family protein
MTDDARDPFEFDDTVALALAATALGPVPRAAVRIRMLERVAAVTGFAFRFAADSDWQSHAVAGVRMKVLAVNPAGRYATVLVDVAPGVRFPAHHHRGDEECYVISGSIETMGQRLGPGDFLHATAGTDHGELWSPNGAQVLLVVSPEDLQ